MNFLEKRFFKSVINITTVVISCIFTLQLQAQCTVDIVTFTATGLCDGCSATPECETTEVTVLNSDDSCCVGPNNPNSSRCKQLNIETGSSSANCYEITGTPQDNGANWWMVDGSSGDCGTLVELGGGTEIVLPVFDDGGTIEIIICKQGTGTMSLELCAIPCCTLNSITIPDQAYACYEDVPSPTTLADFEAIGGVVDIIDLVGSNGCDDIEFTYTDSAIPEDICVDKTFERTFDICFCGDQNIFATHTITISADNLPPILEIGNSTSDFPLIDLGCQTDTPSLTPPLSVTDISDDCSVIDFTEVTIVDDSPGVLLSNCEYLITRTYSVSDACDAVAELTESWTYTLNAEAPIFDNAPVDLTFSCDSDVPALVDLNWTDDCDGTGVAVPTESSTSIDPCTGGSITRTWEYTDQCGLTSTHVQTISIVPNTTIVYFNPPTDITLNCSDAVPAGEDLTYTNNETNANCEETGTVSPVDSGTIVNCGDVMTRTWEYTSACGITISHVQNISLAANQAPILDNAPADMTVTCASEVPAAPVVTWTDDCDGTGDAVLTEVDNTVACTGGLITRTWAYTDQCGETGTHVQNISVVPNTAIAFVNPPADITLNCSDPVPPGTDLNYTNNDTNCEESGTVSPVDSGTISMCGDAMTRTWEYTSPCGVTITHIQNISLVDDSAPILDNPPVDLTVSCTSEITAAPQVTWNDDCDGTGIADLTEVDNTSTCTGGTIERTYSTQDLCGNPVSYTQTITVLAQSAVAWEGSLPSDIIISCGDPTPTADDLNYSNGITNPDCLISGSISAVDSGTLDQCGDQITRTWTLPADPDNCIEELTHTITISLLDTGMPAFASLPLATINVTCPSEIPAVQDLVWVDDCDGTGSVPYTETGSPDLCTGGNITRTWTYTDICGNGPITFTQTYVIAEPQFVSCDDGDPCTINDMEKVDCEGNICVPCQGISTDCGGATNSVACDDGDPCTDNDVIEVACDGSICIPCQGTPTDCSGDTTTLACDDGDPCTINDMEEIACDGSICIPCIGTPNPTPDPTPPTGSSACTDGSTTLSISDCGGTVTWYDAPGGSVLFTGDNFDTPPITTTTTFYATCTIAGCESDPVSVEVTIFTPEPPVITGPALICTGQETITLTADPGYADYDWGTGAGPDNTLIVSDAGTFSVTVTDNNGCTSEASISVDPAVLPEVGISGPPSFCIGNTATLNAPSGFVSYEWGPDGGTNQSLDVSNSGTYTVTVTDENGCTGENSFTIIEADGLQPEITGDFAFCEGGSTDITVGSGYATIAWSPTGESTETISADVAQTYSVTVTDADGCTGITSVEITENPNPTPIITAPDDICSNSSETLNGEAGYAAYEWGDGSTGQDLDITGPGTYSLTVTDDNGCQGETSVTVSAAPDPVVDITGDLLLCPGDTDIATISATAGYVGYVWSNGGSTNENLDVSNVGTYTVTVTDENGCTNSASVDIMNDTPPEVSIDGNVSFCSGFSTTLTAIPSSTSYEWSGGETTESIEVTESGTYFVTVTDEDGCTNSANIVVSELSELMPQIEGDLDICPGGSESIDLSLLGSYETYDWGSGPGTTEILTVTGAGTYSVTVTDANGCSGNSSITIIENVVDDLTISGGPTFCTGTTLNLDAVGDFSSYTWSNGNSGSSIGITTEGTYSVTATDANGCTNTAEITVTEIPDPMVDITGDLMLCPGGGDMVTLIATSGYTNYEWSDGGSTTNENTVGTIGSYTVTVTDENGCTNTATVDVTEDIAPPVTIDGNLTFCTDFSTTLTATAGYTSYEWSSGETTNDINVDMTGTFSVTVTDEDGCTNTASVDVTELTELMPNIIGELDICPGQQEETTLSVDGSFQSYNWGDDGTGTDPTLVINQAGTYSVTVTDDDGCTGNTTITVIENVIEEVTISGGDQFCAGTSLQLTATSGFAEYIWSNGGTGFASTISQPGTYSVTVTDDNGCTNSAEITITENPNPVVTITGETGLCEGENSILDAGTWTAYEWSDGSTEQTLDVSTPGDYTVTVTDENGCTTSATANIIVNELPEPVVSGDLSFCIAGSTTLNVDGSYSSYEWSNGETTAQIIVDTYEEFTVTVTDENGCTNTASVTTELQDGLDPTITGPDLVCVGSSIELSTEQYDGYLWSDGTTGMTISVTGQGTYTVTVSDSGGCTGVADFIVTEAQPEPVTITGEDIFCSGLTTTITADGNLVGFEWSNGEFTQSIDVGEVGIYTVTATDANGCTSTNEIEIFEAPLPEPTLYGDPQFCIGETTIIGVTEEYISYEWSTGETTQEIETGIVGTYTVTVTDENGCIGTNSIEVTEYPLLEAEIRGSLIFCIGGFTELTAEGYAEQVWSTGETTESIVIDQPGNYSVTVTDENGCVAETSVEVVELEQLEPEITGPDTFCEGGQTFISAGYEYQNYIWDDEDGNTTSVLTVTEPGLYSVTVTDDFGCTGEASYEVFSNPSPVVELDGITEVCEGGTTQIFATTGFDAYEWSPAGDSDNIEVENEGTYTVTVTDQNGCTASNSIYVNYNDNPEPEIWGLDVVCYGYPVTLQVSEEFVEYEWSNGETTQEIEYFDTETAYVTVTDENGCTGVTDFSFTTHEVNLTEITGSPSFCTGGGTILDAGLFISYEWEGPVWGNEQFLEANIEGLYTVYVTDYNGCTTSASVEVTISDSLEPTITGNTTICEGESAFLDAGVFDSYLWEGPEGGDTQILEVTTPGTYYVTVYDGTGCNGTAEIEVIAYDAPVAVIDGNTSICGDETTVLSVDEYSSIEWSNGSTAQSIAVNQAGSYTVTVTDVSGCTGASSITVTEGQAPEVVFGGAAFYCEGSSTTINAGLHDSYTWSTGETTQSISVSTPGIVSVTITDEAGCEGSGSIEITEIPAENLVLSGSTSFCVGSSTTLDAGEGYSSYIWSNGETSQSITITTEGNYGVTVTNDSGCELSTNVDISQETSLNINILGNTIICDGETTILDAGIFDSYIWTTPEGPFNTQTIEVSTPGTYSVVVDDGNGCSGEGTIDLSLVDNNPAEISGPTSICDGETVTLTLTEAFETYLWSNGATTESISVNNGGTYSVTVTNINGCNSETAATIAEQDIVVASIIGPENYCSGQTVILDAGDFESYQWSIPGATEQFLEIGSPGEVFVTVTDSNGCEGVASTTLTPYDTEEPNILGSTTFCIGSTTNISVEGTWETILWSTGDDTEEIEISEEGNYSVTVTDGLGCTASTSIDLIGDTNLTVNIDADVDVICNGDASNIYVNGNFDGYIWSNGQTTASIDVDIPGLYVVTVSDQSGCTGSDEIIIELSSIEQPSDVGIIPICPGEMTTISLNETYVQYTWSTGETGPTIDVDAEGTYYVTVNNIDGCEATGFIVVEENQIESPNIEGEPFFCDNSSTTLSVSGYETYIWNVPGENGSSIEASEEGTYSVTVTNTAGCEAVASIELSSFEVEEIELAGSTSFCVGTSTFLSITNQFESYEWSNGETGPSVEFDTAGEISVTVTDANGCLGYANAILSEDSNLTPTITGDNTICEGATTILNAGEGFGSYQWSNGQNSQTIEVSEAGTYSVTVADASGSCFGDTSFDVNTSSIENPNISGPELACPSELIVLSVGEDYSGYVWSNGDDSQSIEVLGGGIYSVTVTNEAGCESENEITVEELEEPSYTISSVDCSDDMETYSITIQTEGQTVTNNLGLNNEQISDDLYQIMNIDTSSSITITISNGLASCDAIVLVDSPNCGCPAIADAGPDFELTCDVNQVILGGDNTSVGANITYEWHDNNGNILGTESTLSVNVAGNYTLIVTDSDFDCSISDQVTVESNDLPEPFITGDDIFCEEMESILTVTQDFESYLWSNGETTQSITVSESGSYEVTVTDEQGCEGYQYFNVEVIEIPNYNIVDIFCNEDMDSYTVIIQTSAENIDIDISNELENIDLNTYQISGIDTSTIVNITYSNGNAMCEEMATINPPNCFCSVIVDAGPNLELTCDENQVIVGGTNNSSGPSISYEWIDESGNVIGTQSNLTVNVAGTYTLVVTDTELNCSNSDQVTVISNNLPEPIVTGEDIICEGMESILTVTETFDSYQWSNGETTQSITVIESGTYDVTVTDDLGCEGFQYFNVEVVEAPTYNVIDIFCNEDMDSYSLIIQTNADNIDIDISNSLENIDLNTYQITGIDTSTAVNFILSNSELMCEETASIHPPNCFCTVIADSGMPAMLNCQITEVELGGPLTSTGNNIVISWFDSNGTFISDEQYITVSEPGYYTLEVYDVNEDCSVLSSVLVEKEEDEPIAIILSNMDNVIDCEFASIELYVNPEDNISYTWSVENDEMNGTSIEIEEGGEIILMAIDTISGCANTDTIMIQDMSAYPYIDVEQPSVLDCNNPEVLLQASSLDLGNELSIEWFDSDGNMLNNQNDSLQVDYPGLYIVEITDLVNGCSNSDTIIVEENFYYPEVEAGPDSFIECDETETLLSANIINENNRDYSIAWTNSDGNLVSDNNEISAFVSQEGMYYVEIIDEETGCKSMDSLYVNVDDSKPYGIIAEAVNPPCSNEETGSIVVNDILGGEGPYNFTLNGSNANEEGMFENLGSGMYELLVVDQNGCVHDTIVEIYSDHEVSIQADPPVIQILPGEDAEVILNTNLEWSEVQTLEWDNTAGLSCQQCLDPTISTDSNQEYQITLYDIYGCVDTTTFRVLVDIEENIWAPNIITPGKGERANQKFTVYTNEHIEIIEEMYIFDRWGELMFSNFEFPPNKTYYGWDGKFNGEHVVPGVYVFLVHYRKANGKKAILKGDVTVIR